MNIKVKDIAAVIEQAAPLALQENYDNSGLIVGNPEATIEAALICVDITEGILDEAEAIGANMVIAHHPIIFHPLKKLTGSNYVQRIVERALKKGIALYASHTNLDAVKGGMSYRAAETLGLKNLMVLSPSQNDPEAGFGVAGELEEPIRAGELLSIIKEKFNVSVIRHSEICRDFVSKVAVCTGSGASLIEAAVSAEADIYIAADFKYNNFIDADGRLIIADIGHFESEYCAIDLLFDIITKKIANFAVHKSRNSRNPINYFK